MFYSGQKNRTPPTRTFPSGKIFSFEHSWCVFLELFSRENHRRHCRRRYVPMTYTLFPCPGSVKTGINPIFTHTNDGRGNLLFLDHIFFFFSKVRSSCASPDGRRLQRISPLSLLLGYTYSSEWGEKKRRARVVLTRGMPSAYGGRFFSRFLSEHGAARTRIQPPPVPERNTLVHITR